MTADGAAPHALGRRDAAALIGVAAVLEGHLVAGDLEPPVISSLNRHLQSAGLVGSGAGPAELRLALVNLNHRLRHALGEYDEPPDPDTGEVELHIGFPSETAARTFVEVARIEGTSVSTPVPVDGRSYDDGTVRWQVAVRSTTLPLSAEFGLEQGRLLTLAAEHGGRDGGWAGLPPDLRA